MILFDNDDYMLRLPGNDVGQVYDPGLAFTATLGLPRLDRVIVSPEKQPERKDSNNTRAYKHRIVAEKVLSDSKVCSNPRLHA